MTAQIIKEPYHYKGYKRAYHVKIDGIIGNHYFINIPLQRAIEITLGRIK